MPNTAINLNGVKKVKKERNKDYVSNARVFIFLRPHLITAASTVRMLAIIGILIGVLPSIYSEDCQDKRYKCFTIYSNLQNLYTLLVFDFYGIVYSLIGQEYHKSFVYTKAMEYYNKCINIDERLTNTKASAYVYLGDCHHELCNYKEAIDCFEKGLSIATELGFKKDMAIMYYRLGSAYINIWKFDKAMDCFQRQLQISSEIQWHSKHLEALAYLGIGITYGLQHQYDESTKYLEKQVQIAKELGTKDNEAEGYLALGLTFMSSKDYPKALEYLQRALRHIYEVNGNTESAVYAQLFFGNINMEMGEYGKSIRHFHKARHMALEIQATKGNLSVYMLTITCFGTLCLILRKSYKAIDYFLESLNFFTEKNIKVGQVAVLSNLRTAYCLINNIGKAEECSENVLQLLREIGLEGGEMHSYINLAVILCSKGKHKDALRYLDKGLEIAVKTNDKDTEILILQRSGDCYLFLKNYNEARRCYENNLTTARTTKPNETLANAKLGKLYFELANLDDNELNKENSENSTESNYQKSEMYLREAIKGSDWLLNNFQADQDDFKISLFNKFIEAYNILTEVLIQTRQTEEALLVSERGRGRSLSDLLISKYFVSRQDAVSLASSSLKYHEIQALLQTSKLCVLLYTMAYRYIIWVLVHNEPVYCHNHIPRLSRSLKPPLSRNHIFLLPHVCEYEYYIEMLVAEAYDKMDVKDAGINCENRSLETHGHSNENQVVGTSSYTESTGVTSSQIVMIQKSSVEGSTEDTSEQDNRHPLEKLFDILIAPVQSSLTQDEIVIIPQGPLYLVPFAALRDSKNQRFLCETKRIRLAPSISALKTWQECPADYHCKEGALVIGNPTVGKVMFKGEERDFKPLPKAQQEAESIARRLRVTALTESQATKEEVKIRLAKGVAVIHIAAHADSQNGEIALAPSKSATEKSIPEEEDYLLTMREVQQIGVRAKLVVLSCCHSGRGKIEPEGVVGMSRAFLAAGARAVIASLWSVNDHVTSSFMLSLYGYLKRGYSASASLKEAMEDIRREDNGRYCHGKYWAPFFLIGDDVTII